MIFEDEVVGILGCNEEGLDVGCNEEGLDVGIAPCNVNRHFLSSLLMKHDFPKQFKKEWA